MITLCPSLLSLLQAAGYDASSVVDTTADSGANLCIIDLNAISANITALRHHLPTSTRLMAIIKAHAYGSDGARMANFFNANGIDILGVAYVSEAVVLRKAGLKNALFAINAAPHEASAVVQWNLEAGVGNRAAIEALGEEACRHQCTLKLHLHIDTGMRRFGCSPDKALELAQQIDNHPYLCLDGLMTHFAAAEDFSKDAFTFQQTALFNDVCDAIASTGIHVPWRHAANSSAAIRFQWPHYTMARLGLALWGFYTSEKLHGLLPLTPALTLLSQIHEIHVCRLGDTVSYGCNYRVERQEQIIAVLPIGYCDGLHRHYSGKGKVMIHNELAPMVGNICMDYMMVDITDIPQARIGDAAIIFGQNAYGKLLPLEGLAQSGNSIVHELIACLGARIPRVFVQAVPYPQATSQISHRTEELLYKPHNTTLQGFFT